MVEVKSVIVEDKFETGSVMSKEAKSKKSTFS